MEAYPQECRSNTFTWGWVVPKLVGNQCRKCGTVIPARQTRCQKCAGRCLEQGCQVRTSGRQQRCAKHRRERVRAYDRARKASVQIDPTATPTQVVDAVAAVTPRMPAATALWILTHLRKAHALLDTKKPLSARARTQAARHLDAAWAASAEWRTNLPNAFPTTGKSTTTKKAPVRRKGSTPSPSTKRHTVDFSEWTEHAPVRAGD